jgi:branched-chain amino acid transport system ATP-binding protein
MALTNCLLEVDAISKNFGGFAALSNVCLRVTNGERLGIIGPNGSGKTTLINCIAGSYRSDAGTIRFGDEDVTALPAHQRARMGLARSFQIPRPFASMTVRENVEVPLEYTTRREPKRDVSSETNSILGQVGLSEKADLLASSLTQVDLRRLELARALAVRPRLLILDEVMAGLSTSEVDTILRLVMSLNERGVTIIMIEHIMRAILRFSQRVVCFDAGQIVAEGEPTAIVDEPNVRRIYLGA